MREQCTCDLVQALSGDVVVLVDPLAIAFEIDLGGGRCFAGEFDWSVLYNKCVLWLTLEFRQRLSWRRGEGVGQNFTVVTAICTQTGTTKQHLRFCASNWKIMRDLRPTLWPILDPCTKSFFIYQKSHCVVLETKTKKRMSCLKHLWKYLEIHLYSWSKCCVQINLRKNMFSFQLYLHNAVIRLALQSASERMYVSQCAKLWLLYTL